MNNTKISRISWLESFVLKEDSREHFSQLTNFAIVVICSFLLILSAKIKVDLYPVPMTMQPLAVLMIAMLCGRNIAVTSVGFYLFQGIIGFPVFAYGGGLPYMYGPTGGFLIGFLLASIIVGELADRGWGKFLLKSVFAMTLGMCAIYLCGIMQLSIIKGFDFAIINGLKPFIIGDTYKILLVALLLPQIWKLTKKSN
ncbi:biotin transporter BioY [bacterium]|nr:biotin transporter BioY [bacterium]